MALFFIGIVAMACDGNRVFEENKKIPDAVWKQDSVIRLEAEITDSNSMHNIYINIRNAGYYDYSNVFLFVKMRFPDGKVAADTLECILADASGKWQGEGLGDIWDNQIMFKPHVFFPRRGKYLFEIQQGMRIPNLKGIMDVGLRIEKSSGHK